jgi:hypothetical protein
LIKRNEPFVLDDLPSDGNRGMRIFERIIIERDNIILRDIYLNFIQENKNGG